MSHNYMISHIIYVLHVTYMLCRLMHIRFVVTRHPELIYITLVRWLLRVHNYNSTYITYILYWHIWSVLFLIFNRQSAHTNYEQPCNCTSTSWFFLLMTNYFSNIRLTAIIIIMLHDKHLRRLFENYFRALTSVQHNLQTTAKLCRQDGTVYSSYIAITAHTHPSYDGRMSQNKLIRWEIIYIEFFFKSTECLEIEGLVSTKHIVSSDYKFIIIFHVTSMVRGLIARFRHWTMNNYTSRYMTSNSSVVVLSKYIVW